MREEKQFGLYNTFKNPAILDTLDEVDIYKKIEYLKDAITAWSNHYNDKPWALGISTKQLVEAKYNLEYLIYYTRKFGVEFSREPNENEHVEMSESFNAWFNFWNNHFKSMSPEVYNQFIDDKFDGKDISKYMPTGDWKETLEKHSL